MSVDILGTSWDQYGSMVQYSFTPRKPEGSLGRTAQDGHLDSHTAPKLCLFLHATKHRFIFRDSRDFWSTSHHQVRSYDRPFSTKQLSHRPQGSGQYLGTKYSFIDKNWSTKHSVSWPTSFGTKHSFRHNYPTNKQDRWVIDNEQISVGKKIIKK